MMDVVWFTYYDNERPHDKWDSAWLNDALAQHVWYESTGQLPEHLSEACVIFPAGIHADQVDRLNETLRQLDRVVLVLTADEQGLFPTHKLRHPSMTVWVQTPDPHAVLIDGARPLGTVFPGPRRYFGYCEPGRMNGHKVDHSERDLTWSFAGQITHDRRVAALDAMEHLEHNGLILATDGFAQGFPAERYYRVMHRSKFVICPAGAANPDTFRMHEAIAAGAIPIVDACNPDGTDASTYWDLVYPGCPFPRMRSWSDLGSCIDRLLPHWGDAQRVGRRWYAHYLADLATQLQMDLT